MNATSSVFNVVSNHKYWIALEIESQPFFKQPANKHTATQKKLVVRWKEIMVERTAMLPVRVLEKEGPQEHRGRIVQEIAV